MTVDLYSVRPQAGAPTPGRLPERLRGTSADTVLRLLVDALDAAGTMSVPLSVLAAAMDSTPRQVRRAIGYLIAAGVLEVAQAAQAAGRYSSAVYRFARTAPIRPDVSDDQPDPRSGTLPLMPLTSVLSLSGAGALTTGHAVRMK